MADDLATVPHTSGAAERDLSYCLERSRLVGSVHVSGAKNSVLRLMAASLLTPARIALHNYPSDLRDAQIHLGMLEALGKTCVHSGDALVISEDASMRSQLAWPGRSIRNTLCPPTVLRDSVMTRPPWCRDGVRERPAARTTDAGTA